MTDSDPTFDELVSAHLDGESTAEEAARIEDDPELQSRLARFGEVRDAVRAEVTPLADEERDALIARAMGTAIAPPKVVTLPARRSSTARVLAVAAAIIAIAFLGGAVALLGSDGGDGADQSVATGADASSSTAFAEAEGDTSLAPTARDSASSGGASAYAASLGSFPDAEALRDAVTELAPGDGEDAAAPATTAAGSGATEDASPETQAATACALAPGTLYLAEIAGRPVVVVVDATTVTIRDAQDCSTVASFAR